MTKRVAPASTGRGRLVMRNAELCRTVIRVYAAPRFRHDFRCLLNRQAEPTERACDV